MCNCVLTLLTLSFVCYYDMWHTVIELSVYL